MSDWEKKKQKAIEEFMRERTMSEENEERQPDKIKIKVINQTDFENEQIVMKLKEDLKTAYAKHGIEFDPTKVTSKADFDQHFGILNVLERNAKLNEKLEEMELRRKEPPAGAVTFTYEQMDEQQRKQFEKGSFPIESDYDLDLSIMEFDSEKEMVEYLKKTSEDQDDPRKEQAKEYLHKLMKKGLRKSGEVEFVGKLKDLQLGDEEKAKEAKQKWRKVN